MFCQQCGTQIEEGMAFCTNCGAKQVAPEAPNNTQNDADKAQPVMNNPYIKPEQTVNQPVNQNNYARQEYVQPSAPVYTEEAHTGSPKKVGFGEAIKLYFINYVNFRGRSTASEYWFAYLFNFLVSLCTSWIPVVGYLVSLGLLLPGLSLGIRRLHDTGKSWVYMLMGLIPIAGFIILIIQYCKASDADNQWGPAAKN